MLGWTGESQLLRLPYLDFGRCCPVDVMHCHIEGVVRILFDTLLNPHNRKEIADRLSAYNKSVRHKHLKMRELNDVASCKTHDKFVFLVNFSSCS